MDREQLDGGHAERVEVLDDGGVRHAGVRAAQLFRDSGMAPGQPFDVRLVDDRLVPRPARIAVGAPVEKRIDDHRLRHEYGAVGLVGEECVVPLHLAIDGFAVRIEQQFCRVAAMSRVRFPRPMHPIAVALPRPDVRQIAVPDEAGSLRQVDARLRRFVIEQTKLHARRHFGEEREVRPRAVVGRA